MRSIIKTGRGGYHLNHAHENPPTTADEATSRWRSFGYKSMLQEALLDEQYGLCCYSELRADLDGLGYHIEHVRPKSLYPNQTFDYANLAACALTEDDLGAFKANNDEVFGGHAKLSKYDPDLFISCHDTDCSHYFVYLSDGRVVPAHNLNTQERKRAHYTIQLLHLNSLYLINRRRRWWDELDQLFNEHENNNWSLENLAAIDLLPTNGRLSQFFSTTRQFFGRVAEQVIQNGASELA